MVDNLQANGLGVRRRTKPHGDIVAHPERLHQVWTLWDPNAGAQGLYVARGRMERVDVALAHAVPDSLTVEVQDDDGKLVARGIDLEATDGTPICRLTISGVTIEREDIWPGEEDIGRPVILPGGEIGILMRWWNADDQQEWRWSVEFYNHR
jgi:hypothetical protein